MATASGVLQGNEPTIVSQHRGKFGKKGRLRKLATIGASVSLCGTLLISVASASPSGASSKYPPIPKGPITFSMSADLSGVYAPDGANVVSGTKFAQQWFDSQFPNGIDGHKVKIQILNDQSDVTSAVQVADQMVSEKAAGVVQLTYDEAAQADQIDVLRKAGVPIVANVSGLPAGSDDAISKEYPNIFSPEPSTQQYETYAGQWIVKKGFTKVAFLNDGVTIDTQAQSIITAGMGSAKSRIVKSVTVSPTSVDDAAAIDELKASGADLLVIPVTSNYGPIWQAIQAANWSPTILVSPGAWYSGFNGMGSLVNNAYAYFYNCAASPTETFTSTQNTLMAGFAKATDDESINYFTYISTGLMPFVLLEYAIKKEDSTSPKAITAALSSITRQQFLGFTYTFSSSEHFGLTGPLASAVCHMGAPYAGGVGKVPVKSNP